MTAPTHTHWRVVVPDSAPASGARGLTGSRQRRSRSSLSPAQPSGQNVPNLQHAVTTGWPEPTGMMAGAAVLAEAPSQRVPAVALSTEATTQPINDEARQRVMRWLGVLVDDVGVSRQRVYDDSGPAGVHPVPPRASEVLRPTRPCAPGVGAGRNDRIGRPHDDSPAPVVPPEARRRITGVRPVHSALSAPLRHRPNEPGRLAPDIAASMPDSLPACACWQTRSQARPWRR